MKITYYEKNIPKKILENLPIGSYFKFTGGFGSTFYIVTNDEQYLNLKTGMLYSNSRNSEVIELDGEMFLRDRRS